MMELQKDLYQNVNQTINDAFDRIIAEIHIKKQQKGYQTFMLCGCEPKVGTTTIAINLAIAMANAGWKTLLLDVDLRKKSEAKRLNSYAELGLADYFEGEVDKIEKVICNTNYDNLKYIGSGKKVSNAISLLCSVKMKELLLGLKNEYDYIIIDVPSVATSVDANVLATQADSVVLVTSHRTGTQKMVEKTKKQFDRINAEVSGIIVNKIESKEYRRVMKDFDYFKKNKYITNKKYMNKAKEN